jgi:general secretion pathway protein A
MYEEHFGLARCPFSMTPDPELVYMTAGHREALAGLVYTILQRKGFVALVGEAGTGKSTMLSRTLRHLPLNKVVSSVIFNPTLNSSEFMEYMMIDFGLEPVPESKAQRLTKLHTFLLKTHSLGKCAALIVDEAHVLSPVLLEEIRLLSNLELPGEKLLQIVLAGQPELVDLLNQPNLRQLNQRISVRLNIGLLTPTQVTEYIHYRWTKSAQNSPPFSPESYPLIAKYSSGIPRLVNSICDNALMLAFADKSPLVEARHIQTACRDLCLVTPKAAAAAAGNGAPQTAQDTFITPLRVLESYNTEKRSFWPWWGRSAAGHRSERNL